MPLAFAADAAAMGIEGRFGTDHPDGRFADRCRRSGGDFPNGLVPRARAMENVPPSR